MKVHLTLICFFFLSLQDRNTGLINAQVLTFYTPIDGGNVKVRCSSSSRSTLKFFCKEDCDQKDVLIDTTGVSAQRGRYSIEWRKGETSSGDVFVTITQLTKSDSGRYRCGLRRSLSSASYKYIKIIVVDALLDRTRTETSLYKRTGESVIVDCYFTFSFPNTVRGAFLCKEQCEDNLIETADYTQRDRYAIRYLEFSTGEQSAFVTISQLTKSDSGRYTCGLDRGLFTDPSQRFDIIVTDAPTTAKPNLKNSTSVPISSTPATTPSENAPETTEPGIPLYVGLTAAGLVILLIVAVLIFCRNRSSKPEEPPEETEYASVTGTNRVYEDLREDKQSIAAPVEISSAHTEAKYTRPNGVETDHYSSVTEATSQNTAEEDSSKVTYSELNFSDQTAGSLNSAPSGHSDNVIYSLPR